jgi:hypothetical protein
MTVSVLGASRPFWPLFLHILGAMVLVGAAATGAVAALASASSEQGGRLRRIAFRSFLLVALPAYIVMRVGAEWIYDKEYGDLVPEYEPTWIGIGYITAEGGGVLLVVTLLLSGFSVRTGRPGHARAAGILAAIATIGWLVAVWAMGGKPS